MSRCKAELCPNWTGQGCICEVMGIDDNDWAPLCTYCLGHHPFEQACADAADNLT